MTQTWIEMYRNAPAEVKAACKRAMQGRTTIPAETVRLGEQNFEWPPKFKDIMWQFRVQEGSINDLGGE